ncbi:MAG TPA: SPOR domain-containing protein [Pyrinomonadaceae bacterium]|jgi:cell division protein FtsN|nr:SPOR domain-containing protein [Pyrinomonadaceae bacterium]
MTYDFSFERKSVAAILACATALSVLLFFAGVLVGVGWRAKDDPRADAAPSPDSTRTPARAASGGASGPASRNAAAQDAPPAAAAYGLPQEPVPYEDPARREYAAEGYGPRPYDAQGYGGARGYARQEQAYDAQPGARRDYAGQEDYAPQRYAARDAGAQASTPEAAAPPASTGRNEAARLSARDIDPDPRLVEEAGAPTEESGARPRPSSSYTVQVGAYTKEGEAESLARELENKGYTPKVISGLDAEARTWYAVRIGSYTNAREAGTAASNFAKQEGRRAAVRRAGSL